MTLIQNQIKELKLLQVLAIGPCPLIRCNKDIDVAIGKVILKCIIPAASLHQAPCTVVINLTPHFFISEELFNFLQPLVR